MIVTCGQPSGEGVVLVNASFVFEYNEMDRSYIICGVQLYDALCFSRCCGEGVSVQAVSGHFLEMSRMQQNGTGSSNSGWHG